MSLQGRHWSRAKPQHLVSVRGEQIDVYCHAVDEAVREHGTAASKRHPLCF